MLLTQDVTLYIQVTILNDNNMMFPGENDENAIS
jgi:hypothetical protein